MSSSNKKEKSVNIRFVCQRCKSPIASPNVFSAPKTSSIYSESPSGKSVDSSFIVLPQTTSFDPSNPSPPSSYSLVAPSSSKSFQSIPENRNLLLEDILKKTEGIDFPLCVECSDWMVEVLEKKVANAQKEYAVYSKLVKENASLPLSVSDDVDELEKEELNLKEELQNMKFKRDALLQDIEKLEAEEEALGKEESSFWEEFNEFQLNLREFKIQRTSINNRYDLLTQQLELLKKANVLQDAFRISFDGSFATINGCRLGRLQNVFVEWNEINAGWGNAIFLLDTLARVLHLDFKGYTLHPMGSFSTIDIIDGNKTNTVELYGSGDLAISRLLFNRRFDQAMVAFLQCLQQLCLRVLELDPDFKLPYIIHNDTIGTKEATVSIKLQFNPNELWTTACKFTLTQLKWITVFCSKILADKEDPNVHFAEKQLTPIPSLDNFKRVDK